MIIMLQGLYLGWLTPETPASTINAISYEELLRRFLYKINELVKEVNSVEEFMQAVKKELDEFNEHVKEVTTAEIQRLYENGDLQNILQDVSDEYFEALRTELYNIINNIHQSYDRETRSIILFREV